MADWEWRNEEEQKPKEKKYVTRKEFYICFVLLVGFIFFQSLTIKERIQQAQNNVTNAVYQTEDRISSTINSIPRNIEQGIEDANNPFRESSMEIIDVDLKGRTATICMTASPKEYQDGMSMKFMVSCDGGEVMEVPAAAGIDRTFTAETEVPFCGVASATVHMKKDGTEYIQSMIGVNVENVVLPYFSGNRGGSVTWQASQDFVTFDGDIWIDVNTPEWIMNLDKGISFDLENEKIEVYVDGKSHKTLPVEIVHKDEYTRSYLAYINGENKIKLKNGKEIAFIFKAEDNNGLKYSYEVEKGTWDENNGYITEAPAWNTDGADPRLTIE